MSKHTQAVAAVLTAVADTWAEACGNVTADANETYDLARAVTEACEDAILTHSSGSLTADEQQLVFVAVLTALRTDPAGGELSEALADELATAYAGLTEMGVGE